MNHPFTSPSELWPLALYLGVVVLVVTALIGASQLLGEKHAGRATAEPYESGLPPTGTAWRRIHVHYYLVAVFFVLFDLESVFLFCWAISVREAGWSGYVAVAVFIGVLLALLVYLGRVGALDWASPRNKR